MNHRGMVPVFIVVLSLLAALALAAVVLGVFSPEQTLEKAGEQKYFRICDVQVYNGYLKESKMTSFSCKTGNKCILSLPSSPLSIFSDEVRVRLEVGDRQASSSLFNLDEGKSYTTRVSACSSSTVGRLTLLDEKSQQVGDAQGVVFG